MTPRQEALRNYLLAIMGSGALKNTVSPMEMLQRASAAFASDFPTVAKQMIGTVADGLSDRVAESVSNVAQRVASDLLREINHQISRAVRKR